jgi:hypothetical protein
MVVGNSEDFFNWTPLTFNYSKSGDNFEYSTTYGEFGSNSKNSEIFSITQI